MLKFHYLRGSSRHTTTAVLEGLPYDEIDWPVLSKNRLALARLLLERYGPDDVILTDSSGYNALVLAVIKRLRKFRMITRLRGDPMSAAIQLAGWKAHIQKWFLMYLLKTSDLVLFNSHHVREQSKYKFLIDQSAVVYNPLMMDYESIDLEALEQLRSASTRLKILSVTNFDYPEKIRPLAEAVNNWVDQAFFRTNDIEWSIVGDGTLFEEFKKNLNTDIAVDRLTFYGFRDDVAQFYRSHHIFAHMSGFDSLPNVILEAGIHGLPIITIPTSGGTLEAMLDQKTGFVVSTSCAFRRVILAYQASHDLRWRHGKKGRDYIISNFTIKKQQDTMQNILAARMNI